MALKTSLLAGNAAKSFVDMGSPLLHKPPAVSYVRTVIARKDLRPDAGHRRGMGTSVNTAVRNTFKMACKGTDPHIFVVFSHGVW